jgi:hypothetical protein
LGKLGEAKNGFQVMIEGLKRGSSIMTVHGGQSMSVNITENAGKTESLQADLQPTALGQLSADLDGFVRQAAHEGRSLADVERSVLDRVLAMGFTAINTFVELQGDGELGETVTTEDGSTLVRSDERVSRRLRTIFGCHTFYQFAYARGVKRKIELRPLDARMSLPAGVDGGRFLGTDHL